MARSLMILGTASHVGKSVLTAAFCRILVNRGLRAAPFKAQNMALNSAATPEGLEIGRAQAMQAEACRIPASVDMNPILIKPSSDTGAQVVVNGRIWGTVTAADFHQRKVRELFPIVCESFERLASAHDVVVLEGAGSPAEINLKHGDLVNMRMAAAADAACVLVGDIDRGGVFASLVGTLALLEPEERTRIRGFLINKFRGDETLLRPGIRTIEDRLGIPCVGVVPHLRELGIDEEDSVALDELPTPATAWTGDSDGARSRRRDGGTAADASHGAPSSLPRTVEAPRRDLPLRVGVVRLPHLANFTDFDPLMHEPAVALAYLTSAEDVARADVLILPGTKQTLDDLAWLEARGLAAAIRERAARGGLTVGICGGLQMLGRRVSDPEGTEGGGTQAGLGLLAVETTLARHKVTVLSRARLCEPRLFGMPIDESCAPSGYEIHVGVTHVLDGATPFATLTRDVSTRAAHVASTDAAGASAVLPDRTIGRVGTHGTAVDDGDVPDGAVSTDGRIAGTYLHGLFDDDGFRHAWIGAARAACGLAAADPASLAFVARERDSRFERLAAAVARACDVELMLGWLELPIR